MTDHTTRVDDAHTAAVETAQKFLLDTSVPGTLEGLAEQVEAVQGAMSDLADIIGDALDADAELFTGWAKLTTEEKTS